MKIKLIVYAYLLIYILSLPKEEENYTSNQVTQQKKIPLKTKLTPLSVNANERLPQLPKKLTLEEMIQKEKEKKISKFLPKLDLKKEEKKPVENFEFSQKRKDVKIKKNHLAKLPSIVEENDEDNKGN